MRVEFANDRVIATAAATFTDQLRARGAVALSYGDGLPERVSALLDKSPDLILDVAPVSGTLPALVQIAGDPKRVMTISDFAAAKTLGVRSNLEEPGMRIRYDVLNEFADLATQGRFSIPIARTLLLTSGRRRSPSAKASRHGENSSFCPDPFSPVDPGYSQVA